MIIASYQMILFVGKKKCETRLIQQVTLIILFFEFNSEKDIIGFFKTTDYLFDQRSIILIIDLTGYCGSITNSHQTRFIQETDGS